MNVCINEALLMAERSDTPETNTPPQPLLED